MKYRIKSAYKDVNGDTHYYVQTSKRGIVWITEEYSGGTSIEQCKEWIRKDKEYRAFEGQVVYQE